MTGYNGHMHIRTLADHDLPAAHAVEARGCGPTTSSTPTC